MEQIGAGGAGRAFRAHDLLLNRTVAVKLLRPGHDEVARARLRAEARIAANLSAPGIARVLDFGEEDVDGEPAPYLVMEYVPGTTLRDLLRAGPLPPRRAADFLAQTADALASAHAAGVVHRDVKPGNIMITPEGTAVLLDFGIAQPADYEPLTATGMIVGTVDYISPEQATGQRATPRSDIYALGVVAYEALTGQKPLTRDTQAATLLAHTTTEMPMLPVTLPEALRSLVAQMVRRDPAERPGDAAEVAIRARAAANGHPDPWAAPGASPAPYTWRQNRRVLAGAITAAVAAMAFAAVILTGSLHHGSGPAAALTASNVTAHHPSTATRHRSVSATPRATTTRATTTSHPVVARADVRRAPARPHRAKHAQPPAKPVGPKPGHSMHVHPQPGHPHGPGGHGPAGPPGHHHGG